MPYKTINGKLVKVRNDAPSLQASKEVHETYNQAVGALEYIKAHSNININKIKINLLNDDGELSAFYEGIKELDLITFQSLLQQYFTGQGFTQLDEYEFDVNDKGQSWGQRLDEMFPGSKITQH